MKLPLCSFLALGACGVMLAADPKLVAPPTSPSTGSTNSRPAPPPRDKISYAIGVNVGNSLKMQFPEANVDEITAGIRDTLAGKGKFSDQEIRETMMAWQQEAQAKRMEKRQADLIANKKAGEEWLAANAKKPDVKVMPDGLQYKVLISGKGPQPKPTDTFTAHYRGTLIDGTEFDSSYTSGKPLTLPVMNVIPGWQEALTNMHVGDKWELYIPSQLAYRESGMGQKIGPNATLIFEMELLSAEAPKDSAAAPVVRPSFPSLKTSPGTPGTPQIKVQPAPAGK